MVHIVNKGKTAEREVVTLLNSIINEVIKESKGMSDDLISTLEKVAQRNQNQSAAGGSDIMLFGLAIEVKRQENLNIEEWWRQACKSADRNNDRPVLIYRQNRKSWHVIMESFIPLRKDLVMARAQINLDDFKRWFKEWVIFKIKVGEVDRV